MEIIFLWSGAMAAALSVGFCIGRMTMGRMTDGEKNRDGETKGKECIAERRVRNHCPEGLVGSPVSGEIEDLRQGERPVVVIRPGEDRIYAPAGGKIKKLFPLGNALLFRTEFGAELYIQAGDTGDELLGRYFRPRVVQNEVVGKGKLLMEFDRRGLEAEGASSRVSLALENGMYDSEILAAQGEQIRCGEELLQVQSEAFDTCRG